jgi:LysR family transcriptional regulator for bpeEF and oprC
VLCCSPEIAASLPKHPRELDAQLCIGNLSEERYTVRPWHLSHAGETIQIRPDGCLHFNSGADELVAARAGIGVACVLDVVAGGCFSEGTLVQVYPEWTAEETRTLYVVAPKSRAATAKVKAFTDFLFEMVAKQQRPPRPKQIVPVRRRRMRR